MGYWSTATEKRPVLDIVDAIVISNCAMHKGSDLQQRGVVEHGDCSSNNFERIIVEVEPEVEGTHNLLANVLARTRH